MSVPQIPHSAMSTVALPGAGGSSGKAWNSTVSLPVISAAVTSATGGSLRDGRGSGRGRRAGPGDAAEDQAVGVGVAAADVGGEADRRRADLGAVDRRCRDRLEELRVLEVVGVLARCDLLVVAGDRAVEGRSREPERRGEVRAALP